VVSWDLSAGRRRSRQYCCRHPLHKQYTRAKSESRRSPHDVPQDTAELVNSVTRRVLANQFIILTNIIHFHFLQKFILLRNELQYKMHLRKFKRKA